MTRERSRQEALGPWLQDRECRTARQDGVGHPTPGAEDDRIRRGQERGGGEPQLRGQLGRRSIEVDRRPTQRDRAVLAGDRCDRAQDPIQRRVRHQSNMSGQDDPTCWNPDR